MRTLPLEASSARHPKGCHHEATSDADAPLFPEQDAQPLRSRWDTIQTTFVDNPRQAVEQADHLVAETIKRLADMFAEGRCGFVLVDSGSAPGRRVSRPRCGAAGFASALAYAFRAAGLGIEKSQREVRRVLEKTGSTHRSR